MIEQIGPVECNICGRQWIAAMESSGTERLECPDCGYTVNLALAEEEELSYCCNYLVVQTADEIRCEMCNQLVRLV